jgi:hypothetical protein
MDAGASLPQYDFVFEDTMDFVKADVIAGAVPNPHSCASISSLMRDLRGGWAGGGAGGRGLGGATKSGEGPCPSSKRVQSQ